MREIEKQKERDKRRGEEIERRNERYRDREMEGERDKRRGEEIEME